MKIPKLGIAVAVTLVVLAMLLMVVPVGASPAIYPCNFYGTATVDGVPVGDGTEISAWFEGVQVASTVTGAGSLADNEYALVVNLDEINEGAAINFKIGALWANETGIWQRLQFVEVNLTTTKANNPPNVPSNPSPADHAIGISTGADLSWTGGDPDIGDTVTSDVYFGTSTSPPLVSNDQAATTYDPGTLSYNTHYYWKIMATDNHGASTTGPLWSFTTADITPPTVVRTSPRDGATGVAVTTKVTATFSEAMDATTITVDSFTLDGVAGRVAYNSSTYTATFTPSANLAYSTTYTATLSTAITDVAGNHLASVYTWSFTTGAKPAPPPPPEEEEEEEIAPPPELGPRLSVSNLRISPDQVSPNQPVTVSIDVSNAGDRGGSKTVNLMINGEFEQSAQVGVSAHGGKSISFTVSRANPGVYSVYIEGASGWFTVLQAVAPSAPVEAGLGTGGLIAIVVIAIILIGGLTFAFLYRRRSA
jgi:hypothetical protein